MPRQSAALGVRKAPRQSRSAHTVEALLEAAALVLEEGGLEGFNTNAVAQRAGASIGTLYQYFSSKDALTLALLQREEGKFRDAARAASELTDWREAMDAFIGVAARQQLERPNLARLLDQQEGRPDIRAALNKGGSFVALMAEILDKPGVPAFFGDGDGDRRSGDGSGSGSGSGDGNGSGSGSGDSNGSGGSGGERRALAAADLLAIIRGMTDAAGERGELDPDHLARRIRAAAYGYLAVDDRPAQ